MAVTSRELRGERRPLVSLQSGNISALAYIITALLALLAIYVVLSTIVMWGSEKLDDLRYGRPRTFHMTAPVAPGEDAPTRFVAMNLDRQVIVFEISGSDVTQVRTIPGPYLFGAGEDLTPVTMRMADVNVDGVPDLIVRVKDEEMIYMKREAGYELITPEERQQIISQGQMP